MKKALIPWISVGALAIIGIFIVFSDGTTSSSLPSGTSAGSNVTLKDWVQYVSVGVKGGYNPRNSTIQWGMPTKLVMKTNGTYDCSSSLIIRSMNYRNHLPATGETEIDLGTPKSGDTIQGTCGMGMYSFAINVN